MSASAQQESGTMSEHAAPSSSFKDIERDGWNRLAGNYGGFTGAFTPQAVEPLLNAARVAAGMRILDMACGPGYVAGGAAARGAAAVGVDFAPAMVAEARRNFPTAEFRPANRRFPTLR
jgi:2-polyprenyl-3-methyl-5-hydroxy-6-metoxy-1,4-benzoquinol methylase